MSRPDKQAYDLSDAEKRDLIALIQQGKPLPEKYRFVLFEDKREVELVWNGKTRDVCTTVLPFQTLEHIDEPRTETKRQEELFDPRGRQLRGWTNKLIWGDNKLILSSLKSGALRRQIEEAGGLKLIYIDPPFDVGADFSMDIEIGGETFHKEPNLLEQIAYRDTWGRGADSFIAMIYERLILMRDLLAEDGSIYVHIGPNVTHYVKAVADEVFGADRFQNELIWRRAFGHGDSAKYGVIHDSILYYGKGERRVWNRLLQPPDKDYVETFFDQFDPIRKEPYQRLSLSAGGLSGGGYGSRKEMIKVPRGRGLEGHLPGIEPVQAELQAFEERWTGGYIFENEWQSFRTRQNRQLELTTSEHSYTRPGRYTVAVKVIDIFGNDTMTLVPVNVG